MYSAGDMVTPTGGGQSVTTKISAPAVGVGITSLGPDTLTFSPSPRHPRSTPTRSQAWTPGPPSKRGNSSTARQDMNSTGQDVELPSTAPSLGTSPGSSSSWTSSFPRTPEPTHGSPPKTTVVPLNATRGRQENLTVGPLPVTASPTGYVAWHPSPTWETPPLNSTRLQDEDPRPSFFPSLPSASTPVAPESPACGKSSGGRDTSGNLSLCEPWCQAWQQCRVSFLISNIRGPRHRAGWPSAAGG